MPPGSNTTLASLIGGYGKFLADLTVPIRTRIQMGTELWRARTLIEQALEPLKANLREEALESLEGTPGSSTIEGEGLTQAVVTVLPPTMKLRGEGLTIAEAQEALGPDFDRVFRVILRPEANVFLHTLPPKAQSYLAKVLDQAKETPRVSLQSMGSGVTERK